MEKEVLLSVQNLQQYFKLGKRELKAVDNVSFDIYKGEVFGLVGESGCGKTTTGRSIIRLYDITGGSVYYKGERICAGTRSYKDAIKQARKDLKENKIKNIKFYYVDIKNTYKKIFKGVMYSIRLNIWHKKAFPLVKKICRAENIDVIHQITPIEFRSIGRYGEIENTKFVCGPLGGGEFLPRGLRSFAKGNMVVEYIRAFSNWWCRFRYKLSKRLQKCDYIMFANNETQDYMSDLVCCVGHTLHFDNGISESDVSTTDKARTDKFIILVAGRLAYRKGHKFL